MSDLASQPALPRLGAAAPAFEADSTLGRIALGDFAGSWVVLFSHPADFTPVCTTEFLAFAEIAPRLRDMNCEPVGLSIDSIYAHIGWLKRIEELRGAAIDFPVIADANRAVATAYGMIHEDDAGTETSRCLFVIDPKGIMRAMIYYPLTTGRNMAEILRLVEALQATDTHGLGTPANWQAGDRMLHPAPKELDMANRAAGDGEQVEDWFLRFQSVPTDN
ncbi:MAG: peroxiredoxin [Alphaproteobacteria bacterium]